MDTESCARTVGPRGTQHLRASLQSAGAFDVELALFDCFFRCLPVLARYDVGGVPARPVVLRSRRFVLTMMLLRLAQKLCQRRDIQIAESSSGQPRCNFLKQPGVAVGVIECGEGKVAAVIGCRGIEVREVFHTARPRAQFRPSAGWH
jgi:hypothetical protein